jgi:hypothetical protein
MPEPSLAATDGLGAHARVFPSVPPQKSPSPVLLALTAKGFKPRDIKAEDFEDNITLELYPRVRWDHSLHKFTR